MVVAEVRLQSVPPMVTVLLSVLGSNPVPVIVRIVLSVEEPDAGSIAVIVGVALDSHW